MSHILDVRLEEVYERAHLPGSVVNPVFQMGFIERIPSEWAKTDPIQIIGEDNESAEASMAVEKLQRAGFEKVSVFSGGFQGWISEGNTPEGHGNGSDEPDPLSDTVPVDLELSELQWTGRNLLNRHYGTLNFSKASLEFDNDQLTGGWFEIDWDSLACTDLAGNPAHDILMTHLKDHDFFDVEAFDSPTVNITKVTDLQDASPGACDLKLQADLTLKNITKPIEFHATSGRDRDGHFGLQAAFDIDRTEWKVLYGSGRFFKNLGMHLVNDRIEIGLKIVTQ
jgi:polyisoprenoid-binding protein YceI/rhodanese-related sulfurtransferase